MKPQRIYAMAMTVLLAGAALCVGGRMVLDVRRAEQARRQAAERSRDGPQENTTLPVRPVPRVREVADAPALSVREKVRRLLSMGNRAERSRRLLEMMEHFQPGDWAEAMAGLGERANVANKDDYRLLLAGWAERDPGAALAWLGDRWGFESEIIMGAWVTRRSPESGILMNAWLDKNPGEAMTWLRDHYKPNDLRWCSLMTDAIGAMGTDLPRIREALLSIPGKEALDTVTQQLKNSFKEVSPGELVKWMNSMEPDLRSAVFRGVVRSTTEENRITLLERIPDGVSENAIFLSLQDLAISEKITPRMLESMQPGAQRTAAMGAMIWGIKNAQMVPSAMELMQRWPEDVKDYTVNVMMRKVLLMDDPEPMLNELPPMNDPKEIVSYHRDLLKELRKKNPDAVGRWLDSHPEVPQEVRAEFEE